MLPRRMRTRWLRRRRVFRTPPAARLRLSCGQTETEAIIMTILDLAKATLVCGGISFLIYRFPLLGQVVLISFLGLLWLLYARKAIQTLRRSR